MLNAGVLTFREFVMAESLPLATIHEAVLEFLRDRDDAVLFGAQAVNAYVDEPRMTQDVDILSLRAKDFAREMREYLHRRFHIAVRVRTVAQNQGYRVFQVTKPKNRHLVDIRQVTTLPKAQRIAQVFVMMPVELIAWKMVSYYQRRGKPKSGTDWRDIALLLLTFPELKCETGAVSDCLKALDATSEILALWQDVVRQSISSSDDDDF
ncbi:MAG: nucleotidyl transferase AbiEii/AbiGii toxin family protein [bacterium]|nr:nucleotidyl transferase AbiEii/AbiGii toxin family protein [bacterium]